MQSFMQLNSSPLFDQMLLQDFEFSEEISQVMIVSSSETSHQNKSIFIQKQHKKTVASKRLGRKLRKQKNLHKQKRRGNKKRNKKGKQYKSADYRKNICGYVTKKALRQFIGTNYEKTVLQMCGSQNVDYEAVKNFYSTKIQRVTGPSHIPELINNKNPLYYGMNQVFLKFFRWFLQERYVRHLYLQGKMELKREYIEYKNRQLLPLLIQFQSKMELETQLSNNLISNIVQNTIQ